LRRQGRTPILAVEALEFIAAARRRIAERHITSPLPAIPAFHGKAEDLPHLLPLQQILAPGEIGLVTDIPFAGGINHIPLAILAEYAGGIDQLLCLPADDYAILEECFDLVKDLLHPLDGDCLRGIVRSGAQLMGL
jgi:hypothetical protein